jgi:DNA-directed RNA polymerase beta subunit
VRFSARQSEATQNELALGGETQVAFMPWKV